MSIADMLEASRRVSRAIGAECENARVGFNGKDIANIRVTERAIVLLVRNAAQQTKLRQLLPRIKACVERAGFLQPVQLRVYPVKDRIVLRSHEARHEFSAPSCTAAQRLSKAVTSLPESASQKALVRLTQTLSQKARPDAALVTPLSPGACDTQKKPASAAIEQMPESRLKESLERLAKTRQAMRRP